MDPNSKDFQALKRKWYKKLGDSGFVDIEDKYGFLTHMKQTTAPFRDRELVFEFYYRLDHYLTAHPEVKPRHRKVLELLSQGRFIRGEGGIAKELGIHFNTVEYIIKKYKALLIDYPSSKKTVTKVPK